jgi:hypothetical protein
LLLFVLFNILSGFEFLTRLKNQKLLSLSDIICQLSEFVNSTCMSQSKIFYITTWLGY